MTPTLTTEEHRIMATTERNIQQLRGLDRKYFVACYGLSLIPAIVYLFVDTKDRGKIYGGAIVGRMIAVLVAIVIYIMAGCYVWNKRDALSGFLNPFNEDPFTSVLTTTEVTITSASREPSLPNFEVREIPNIYNDDSYEAYSVNVEIGQPKPSRPAMFRIPTATRAVALSQENAESFLYARVAFLFFIALLVTWVPSSVNRAYALAHPEHINFGLNLTSALVFSIQGILNTMVYVVTSKSACRKLLARVTRQAPTEMRQNSTTYGMERQRRQELDSDATSMTNLTGR
ncbi:MAG: hypothetical protein Q9195_007264 [Heterodermia aff. obscurata]